MSTRSARLVRLLTAAAAAGALTLGVAACGAEGDGGSGGGGGQAEKPGGGPTGASVEDLKDRLGLPEDLPSELPPQLRDLDRWRDGAWREWDREDWLREARDFVNPVIEDHWNRDRMKDARENGTREVEEPPADEGVTDPAPDAVAARPVATPYTGEAPPVGKVFMETPKGSMVCSGTVVKDPAAPGRSNLVATAGHCVHAGRNGGWFRNVVFVPHYNTEGLSNAQLAEAPPQDVAPHGVWWAKYARTTQHWIDAGTQTGGGGAPQDFAVLKVQPEEGGSGSLEETVGSAVEVDFSAPEVAGVPSLTANGYPAAPPFGGERLYSCTDRPGRLTLDTAQPTMYRIGCTMTAGSSGGGWLDEGGTRLLSVTSIGPLTRDWLAGPRLGEEAEAVFTETSGMGR